MKEVIVTKDPVILEGYQSILKLSKYNKYNLAAILPQEIIDKLEAGREEELKYQQSKLKNPRRGVVKPEPWEEVSKGNWQAKFSWKEGAEPPIVDTEGTLITDENLPLYSGSKVKLAFTQNGYKLPDDSYGTSLKLLGIQVVALNNGAGVDVGDLDTDQVVDMFGTTKGYKALTPNIETDGETQEEEDQPEF